MRDQELRELIDRVLEDYPNIVELTIDQCALTDGVDEWAEDHTWNTSEFYDYVLREYAMPYLRDDGEVVFNCIFRSVDDDSKWYMYLTDWDSGEDLEIELEY